MDYMMLFHVRKQSDHDKVRKVRSQGKVPDVPPGRWFDDDGLALDNARARVLEHGEAMVVIEYATTAKLMNAKFITHLLNGQDPAHCRGRHHAWTMRVSARVEQLDNEIHTREFLEETGTRSFLEVEKG